MGHAAADTTHPTLRTPGALVQTSLAFNHPRRLLRNAMACACSRSTVVHGFSQPSLFQHLLPANPRQKPTAQRRCEPFAGQLQRHIATGELGQFTRLVPQQGVKNASGCRCKCAVVGSACGLVPEEVAIRVHHGPCCQLHCDLRWRGIPRERLRLHLTVAVTEQPQTPLTQVVALQQIAQSLLQGVVIPDKSKVLCTRAHPAQVPHQMDQHSLAHAQGFQQFERLAGPLCKGALVAPFGPFFVCVGIARDPTAHAKVDVISALDQGTRLHLGCSNLQEGDRAM